MLLAANVSIGLQGQEGSQAVLAADFALGKFCLLKRLILFHGKHSVLRLRYIAGLCFYKSMMLACTQLYYNLWAQCSAVSFFTSLALLLYNVAFTGTAPLLRNLDLPLLVSYPAARQGSYYRSLALFVVRAVVHSLVVFSLALWTVGEAVDKLVFSQTVYINLVVLVLLTVVLEAHSLNVLVLLYFFVAIAVLCVVLVLVALLPFAQDYGGIFHLPSSLPYLLLLTSVICLLPVFLLKALHSRRQHHSYRKLSDAQDYELLED
jgi:phospholipid-translocating ATPase